MCICLMMYVSVVDPAHSGVPSTAGRSPGEVDDYWGHSPCSICVYDC